MSKNKFTVFLIIALLNFLNVYSQYNNVKSVGLAPWIPDNMNYSINTIMTNPNTIGYSYYAAGTTGSQLFKYRVGTPGSTILIGTIQPYILSSGDFANPTGVWKFYVEDQNTPPYTIYEVDTATGNLTSIGAPINLRSGHKPTEMEWDQTTNYFYILSSNAALTETQLYRMYWPTKELTWVGPPVSAPSTIVAGGFNANGTYFGIDITTAALWKVNKNTGAWTQIGSLGYPVNYAQDAGFDRSDYSKMLWCACGGTVGLYEVDTAFSTINLIGAFPSYTQVLATGFIGGQCGPQFSLIPYGNTQNQNGPYIINATVTPCGAGIAYTRLFWSRNNPVITDSINMTNTGGNNWTGSIPGNGSPAVYRYYCLTKDSINKTAAAPLGAPTNLYTFLALAMDTSKPVITHTQLTNTKKDNWPDTVIATVTDNMGLDSVWVRWRINSTATKEFKLLLINGNIYKAIFNSVYSDVNVHDTIYYRIIAQDNSSNHNRDSTSLYNFIILPSELTCIGSGNIILQGFPFNTNSYGNRTQLLWLASEILSAGGSGGLVTKIGFNFYNLDTLPMHNFSVKMQTYYDTALTAFIETNWATVYSGTYTVPATGWQYITFQYPFEWDGINNLLVQICFENNSNSYYKGVRGGNINFHRSASEFHDLASACTAFQNPGIYTYRPNVCFKFEQPSQLNNNNKYYPAEYNLSQNYPNPFNPVTRIKFDIKKQGLVSLKIYDILGREMKVLVNEIKSQGSYIVDFNASGFPSGIYLYRIESEKFIETKRMLLIK